MKLEITNGKKKQFFFYAYHLSLWHYSAYKEISDKLRERMGALSRQEEQAIQKIRSILKKYSFDTNAPASAYYGFNEKNIEKILFNSLDISDAQIFIESMKILNPKFEILWKNDSERSSEIVTTLKEVLETDEIISLIDDIEIIFSPFKKLKVVTLVYPENFKYIGGSANTGLGICTVELADSSRAKEGVLVALHELTHSLLREQGYSFEVRKPLHSSIKRKVPFSKEMTKPETLEELFLRFFLPDGYLAKKYLNHVTLDSVLKAVPQTFHGEIIDVIDKKEPITQELVNTFKKICT